MFGSPLQPDFGGSSKEFDVEFPVKFQLHVRQAFADSLCLLHPAMHNSDVAAQTHGTVGASEVSVFYNDLLDFGVQRKKPLHQLFNDCFDGGGFISSWVILLPRLPPQFCDWWETQLGILRETGIKLTVHVILLTDALPCSWEALSRLRGSRLDAHRFDKFRSKSVLFSPSVHTKMNSTSMSFSVLKKVRAITFTTCGLQGNHVVEHSAWQVSLLPSFQTPSRLVVDFDANDVVLVSSLVQVCCYRASLEVPFHHVKSFSATKLSNRRMFFSECGAWPGT